MKNTSDYFMLGLLLICMRLDKKVCYKVLDNSAYCLRTGEYQRTSADFVLELEKRGFSRKKKKSGMWVQGLQVKDTDFAE